MVDRDKAISYDVQFYAGGRWRNCLSPRSEEGMAGAIASFDRRIKAHPDVPLRLIESRRINHVVRVAGDCPPGVVPEDCGPVDLPLGPQVQPILVGRMKDGSVVIQANGSYVRIDEKHVLDVPAAILMLADKDER